jgi:hypothetical protein
VRFSKVQVLSPRDSLTPFLYPVDRGRGVERSSTEWGSTLGAVQAYRSSRRNGFSSADGATALRDITAMATMVKMNGSIRNAS